MADPTRDPDTGVEGPERAPGGMPRWVKLFVVLALVALLLVVVLLTGVVGGGHGPGRHIPGGLTPPSGIDASEDGGAV